MEPLKQTYNDSIAPKLTKEFGYKSSMQVPRVEKVVLNMGVGEAISDGKVLEHAAQQLTQIAGQKAVITTAKKSIASFKLRKGMKIGARVTLRGDRMYSFLYRLFNIALPRVKDFRGFSKKSMDGRGNYTLGVKEQIIFPEIDYDKIDRIRGLDITIVTSAKTDEEGILLLKQLGLPFRN